MNHFATETPTLTFDVIPTTPNPPYSSITCLIFEEIDITQKAKIPLTLHPLVVVFCFLFFFLFWLFSFSLTYYMPYICLFALLGEEKDERLFATLKKVFISQKIFPTPSSNILSTFQVEMKITEARIFYFLSFSVINFLVIIWPTVRHVETAPIIFSKKFDFLGSFMAAKAALYATPLSLHLERM